METMNTKYISTYFIPVNADRLEKIAYEHVNEDSLPLREIYPKIHEDCRSIDVVNIGRVGNINIDLMVDDEFLYHAEHVLNETIYSVVAFLHGFMRGVGQFADDEGNIYLPKLYGNALLFASNEMGESCDIPESVQAVLDNICEKNEDVVLNLGQE